MQEILSTTLTQENISCCSLPLSLSLPLPPSLCLFHLLLSLVALSIVGSTSLAFLFFYHTTYTYTTYLPTVHSIPRVLPA